MSFLIHSLATNL